MVLRRRRLLGHRLLSCGRLNRLSGLSTLAINNRCWLGAIKHGRCIRRKGRGFLLGGLGWTVRRCRGSGRRTIRGRLTRCRINWFCRFGLLGGCNRLFASCGCRLIARGLFRRCRGFRCRLSGRLLGSFICCFLGFFGSLFRLLVGSFLSAVSLLASLFFRSLLSLGRLGCFLLGGLFGLFRFFRSVLLGRLRGFSLGCSLLAYLLLNCLLLFCGLVRLDLGRTLGFLSFLRSFLFGSLGGFGFRGSFPLCFLFYCLLLLSCLVGFSLRGAFRFFGLLSSLCLGGLRSFLSLLLCLFFGLLLCLRTRFSFFCRTLLRLLGLFCTLSLQFLSRWIFFWRRLLGLRQHERRYIRIGGDKWPVERGLFSHRRWRRKENCR